MSKGRASYLGWEMGLHTKLYFITWSESGSPANETVLGKGRMWGPPEPLPSVVAVPVF